MYKKSLTALILGCFLLVCGAAPLRDPTRPAYLKENDAVTDLKVETIIYSPERKIAIVNGKTVSVGEFVSDAKVIAIKEDRVVFEGTSGKFSVLLYSNYKKTAAQENVK